MKVVCPECNSKRARPSAYTNTEVPVGVWVCDDCGAAWNLPKETSAIANLPDVTVTPDGKVTVIFPS